MRFLAVVTAFLILVVLYVAMVVTLQLALLIGGM